MGYAVRSEKIAYVVSRVERAEVAAFIEQNHYSASVNGVIGDYCFGLYAKGELVGAAMFGRMAMAGQWKAFGDAAEHVVELRRLCCKQEAVRNSESFLIGACLRWIRRNTKLRVVVSYADAEQGHTGVIYRASNFKYLGLRKGAKVIVCADGKQYHDKALRTKHNGVLKPFAVRLAEQVKSGSAVLKTTAGKHCFVFNLRS